MKYGYARVSTQDQNLSMQINALIDQGGVNPNNIYKEYISGTKSHNERPEFKKLLSIVKPKDVIYTYKLDRIGRSFTHTIQLIEELSNKEIYIVSLKDGIDTSNNSAMGKFYRNIMSVIAQLERDFISERTKDGLLAAKQRGVVLGAPITITPPVKKQIIKLIKDGTPKTVIAKQFNISRQSIYNIYKNN